MPAGPAEARLATPSVVVSHHSPVVVREAREALALHRRFRAHRTGDNLRRYARARDETALATGRALRIRALSVRDAWARTDRPHQIAVLAAVAQLGAPYRYASSDPSRGFDCSGLTAYAWRYAGWTLYPVSSRQIADAAPRTRATARAGDLVYYPGHVMLSLGVGNAVVHASNPQNGVELAISRGRTLRWGDPTR